MASCEGDTFFPLGHRTELFDELQVSLEVLPLKTRESPILIMPRPICETSSWPILTVFGKLAFMLPPSAPLCYRQFYPAAACRSTSIIRVLGIWANGEIAR